MLNQYFDKIFWINCKHRVDRRKNMMRRLTELKIEAERVECVKGCSSVADLVPITATRELNCGELGCFMSHRRIYHQIKKHGWARTLILEDDAEFAKDFAKQWNTLELPAAWDLFYFGRWNYDHGAKEYTGLTDIGKKPLWKADHCWLTHAYAIDQGCIDHLLKVTAKISDGLDAVLSANMSELNVYAVHPALITQDGTRSSLRAN